MATLEIEVTKTWQRIAQEADTVSLITSGSSAAIEVASGTDESAPAGAGHLLSGNARITGTDLGAGAAVWVRVTPGDTQSSATLIASVS